MIRRSWHIILPIYLDLVDSVAVAQMPPAGTPAAMLAVDLDLIHHHLGYACEAMCYTHVEQSTSRSLRVSLTQNIQTTSAVCARAYMV